MTGRPFLTEKEHGENDDENGLEAAERGGLAGADVVDGDVIEDETDAENRQGPNDEAQPVRRRPSAPGARTVDEDGDEEEGAGCEIGIEGDGEGGDRKKPERNFCENGADGSGGGGGKDIQGVAVLRCHCFRLPVVGDL